MSKAQRNKQKRRFATCKTCGEHTNSTKAYCGKCAPRTSLTGHRDKYPAGPAAPSG